MRIVLTNNCASVLEFRKQNGDGFGKQNPSIIIITFFLFFKQKQFRYQHITLKTEISWPESV